MSLRPVEEVALNKLLVKENKRIVEIEDIYSTW